MSDLEKAAALELKKAEVELLLKQFTLHMAAAQRITGEISQALDSFRATYGPAAVPAAIELFQKFCNAAEKFRKIDQGGPKSAPV